MRGVGVTTRASHGSGLGMTAGWLLALAVIVAFASLGRWQLARMHQKQAKLDAAAHALDKRAPQPLLLASDPKRAGAYDWAAGRGSVAGATVWLAGREDAADPDRLRALLSTHRVDVMQATPAAWRMLLDAGWQGDMALRAWCGGEALPADLAAHRRQVLDGATGTVSLAALRHHGQVPLVNLAILDLQGRHGLIGRGVYQPGLELFA